MRNIPLGAGGIRAAAALSVARLVLVARFVLILVLVAVMLAAQGADADSLQRLAPSVLVVVLVTALELQGLHRLADGRSMIVLAGEMTIGFGLLALGPGEPAHLAFGLGTAALAGAFLGRIALAVWLGQAVQIALAYQGAGVPPASMLVVLCGVLAAGAAAVVRKRLSSALLDPADRMPQAFSPSGALPILQVSLIGALLGLAGLAAPFLSTERAVAPAAWPSLPLAEMASEAEVPPTPSTPAATSSTVVTPTSDPTAAPTPKPTRAKREKEQEPKPSVPAPERSPSKRPTQSKAPAKPKPVFTSRTIDATAPQNTIELAEAVACGTCASGSRVRYIENSAAVVVPVPGVEVAGRRSLTIFYESDGARDLFVSVNGGANQKLAQLPGNGSWEHPATVSTTIELRAGKNTLRFHNPQGPAPDLDRFRIS